QHRDPDRGRRTQPVAALARPQRGARARRPPRRLAPHLRTAGAARARRTAARRPDPARRGRRGARNGRRTMKRGAKQPFIVLTGLSGSGKSQAIRALEDLGYFCVDNLPTTLIPTLAKLSLRSGGGGAIDKVAIVVDVRERGFLSSFPKVFRKL